MFYLHTSMLAIKILYLFGVRNKMSFFFEFKFLLYNFVVEMIPLKVLTSGAHATIHSILTEFF